MSKLNEKRALRRARKDEQTRAAAWNKRVNDAFHRLMDDIETCKFPARERMILDTRPVFDEMEVKRLQFEQMGTAARRQFKRLEKEMARKGMIAA